MTTDRTELTNEERAFLFEARGGLAGAFGGPSPIGDAQTAAAEAVNSVATKWSNRAERLVVLSALAAAANAARDALLDEVLAADLHWVEVDGEWRSIALATHTKQSLAAATGVHVNTITRRYRAVVVSTLAEAQAEAATHQGVPT